MTSVYVDLGTLYVCKVQESKVFFLKPLPVCMVQESKVTEGKLTN
jgi:hypothetical protein